MSKNAKIEKKKKKSSLEERFLMQIKIWYIAVVLVIFLCW